jgi:hypothetical protein
MAAITQEEMLAQVQRQSQQMATYSSVHQAQAQALCAELGQRYYPELVEQCMVLQRECDDLAEQLRGVQRELAALRQASQPAGEAFFRQGAELTFRAQWLEDQLAQRHQIHAQHNAELRERVATTAAQLARQGKAECNRLVRERETKKAALLQQVVALGQEYDAPLKVGRAQLVALSAIVPVDLEVSGQTGLFRE